MRKFAIIGLGRFGQCMLESLRERNREVLAVDFDDAKVQWARDLATKAIKADVLTAGLFQEILPDGLDCAIVDLGDEMERSILVANYLHKQGVPHIIVEAVNAEHAEILRIVGATRIVFPEQEAAEHLAGVIAGGNVLDFFAVSDGFAVIETNAPKSWVGKTLAELDLRKRANINVVAVRAGSKARQGRWMLPIPDHVLTKADVLLLAGETKALDHVRGR